MYTRSRISLLTLLMGGSGVAAILSYDVTASEATFRGIGFLNHAQPYSSLWDVSADGQTVVGTSFNNGNRAIIWTVGAEMIELPPLDGADASAAGSISNDGSVIVGRSVIGCCTTRSTRWLAPDFEPEYLGPNLADSDPDTLQCPVPNCNDHALGLSGDGIVVVGQSRTPYESQAAYHPYRWTEQDGMESLVAPDDAESTFGSANAASDDGSYIAGWFRPQGSGLQHAFRWNEIDGMVFIGTLGGNSEARAVSPNGSIVVGDSSDYVVGRTAFRWTEDEGMVNLGHWHLNDEPQNTVPLALTADGSILVGYGMVWVGTWTYEAIIWDQENGWRQLEQAVADDHGLDISGWTLNRARAISPDGRFIVGEGTNPQGNTEGWLIELPPDCAPADLNCDGVVDGADLLILLAAWGKCGDPDNCPADLNNDGTVDGADLLILLANWG